MSFLRIAHTISSRVFVNDRDCISTNMSVAFKAHKYGSLPVINFQTAKLYFNQPTKSDYFYLSSGICSNGVRHLNVPFSGHTRIDSASTAFNRNSI